MPLIPPTLNDHLAPRRVLFMGTPDFAVPGLRALAAATDLEIVGVFTQPDKPVGRRQVLTPPPIKTLALENSWPIFQPNKIKPAAETIRDLKPDLVVVIAYGKIIPPEILALPTHGIINVHASLLPKYRGAACLNAPILNGDGETGVTIMKMAAGLDTGPILRQAKIKLSGQETLPELHDRLAQLGAELLVPTLQDYLAGRIIPQPQDESTASYVKTLTKEDGHIDWTKSAAAIERLIRAYNPWPGSYGLVGADGAILKILAADSKILKTGTLASNNQSADGQKRKNYQPGELFLGADGRLAVQCGQDALVILRLQLSGGRPLDTAEFLRGRRDLAGQILK